MSEIRASAMSDHWAKAQLIEAHKMLDDMGVPDRAMKPDYSQGKTQVEDKEFSLGIPERIQWLRAHWQPKQQ